jgi:rhomboid family GlyGly-CTERM serine protease
VITQSPLHPPRIPQPGFRLAGGRLVPYVTAVLCLALALGGEPLRQWGRYDRAGLEAGQWWRFVSGHFVHLGWTHLALNLTALWMLMMLMRASLTVLEWVALLGSSMLLIDLGLYAFEAGVDWYVGLSGVLHGVAVAVGMRLWPSDKWSGGLLLVALASKITAEQFLGPSSWSIAASGGPVVVAAHLYGALGGLLALLVLRRPSSEDADILVPPRTKR